MRDQNCHLLWPIYWIGSELELIFMRDQNCHLLWPKYFLLRVRVRARRGTSSISLVSFPAGSFLPSILVLVLVPVLLDFLSFFSSFSFFFRPLWILHQIHGRLPHHHHHHHHCLCSCQGCCVLYLVAPALSSVSSLQRLFWQPFLLNPRFLFHLVQKEEPLPKNFHPHHIAGEAQVLHKTIKILESFIKVSYLICLPVYLSVCLSFCLSVSLSHLSI